MSIELYNSAETIPELVHLPFRLLSRTGYGTLQTKNNREGGGGGEMDEKETAQKETVIYGAPPAIMSMLAKHDQVLMPERNRSVRPRNTHHYQVGVV